MPKFPQNIVWQTRIPDLLVWGFGLFCLISVWSAIISEVYVLAALPLLVLVVYVGIVDFRKLFYLLLMSLPVSTEILLPNGFGTDLPSEPLMIGLFLITILFIIRPSERDTDNLLRHPISILLLAHLAWILVSTVCSNMILVSVKFLLAKIWYLGVFYVLASRIFRNPKEHFRFFWLVGIPLLLTVIVIMIRHAGYGFSFVGIHKVLHPFQRNHVNYAAMLTLFCPYLYFAWRRQLFYSLKWWFLLGMSLLFLVAIYLSFTRAAYVALLIAGGSYFVFKYRLIRPLIVAAVVGALIGLGYLVQHNKYLDFAPNYDRTVTHYEFDNLVEATYKMEDISTMERLYRWVAGLRMSPEEPWVGFGPGNFVNFYRGYTVTSFQTYVSDNPERSGIHSYFLMTLVEQGIIGLLLFLLFSFYLLIAGERIYHQTKDPLRKGVVMSVLLSLVVIDAFLIINDLIETDKVGPFFFMGAALLVVIDQANQKLQSTKLQTKVDTK